jgi:hypothetical protein
VEPNPVTNPPVVTIATHFTNLSTEAFDSSFFTQESIMNKLTALVLSSSLFFMSGSALADDMKANVPMNETNTMKSDMKKDAMPADGMKMEQSHAATMDGKPMANKEMDKKAMKKPMKKDGMEKPAM